METFPSRQEAEELLAWAGEQNPGMWVDHSRTVGRTADIIARAGNLDGDKAYVLGLLHDIGRYEGVGELHHILAGHILMMKKGYIQNARICLTHSFPVKILDTYSGKKMDCTETELKFIQDTLASVSYDPYDGLIQLCDAICLPQGVCLLEVRLMDVARRHGMNDMTLEKWEAFFALKADFDERCGGNIYELFYEEICKVSIYGSQQGAAFLPAQ